MTDERTAYTLQQVTESIRKTLSARYTSSFWVKAEMNKLNHYPHSGHCYPELVEKKDGKVVAQLRANLWKADYERIDAVFRSQLNEALRDGIHIFFLARIQFDSVHGLSLRILDIDPTYTLGELEREKRETIERLKKEQFFHQNKHLKLPLLPQRIAVISVETSKGYADFMKVIRQNPWGYAFFTMLFPALLQGDKATDSILQQLERISRVQQHFDVVALIRGGGGDVGLSCYNNYPLARRLACFPLPVLTGIGHSTNETVAEMVAYHNAITPTELGDFLLQHFHNVAIPVKEAGKCLAVTPFRIIRTARQELVSTSRNVQGIIRHHLQRQHGGLQLTTQHFSHTVNLFLYGQGASLHQHLHRLKIHAISSTRYQHEEVQRMKGILMQQGPSCLRRHTEQLAYYENSARLLDPANVIKRGYSITYCQGKLVRTLSDVRPEARLETRVSDGIIISKIQKNA